MTSSRASMRARVRSWTRRRLWAGARGLRWRLSGGGCGAVRGVCGRGPSADSGAPTYARTAYVARTSLSTGPSRRTVAAFEA